ncbi:MAG: HAMP domain-containing histidine kinase [Chitinophagaceae bacterium]|nr:HAMP domain-containing histidine kinase [Chitinophagaceae bacterium]
MDKAWQYNEQYILQSDSLNKEKISQNFADQETRYQTRQKEERIGSLGKENQLQVLQLQAASRTRWFLILGLVALGTIALLMYFIYRNKEKLNRLLNNKNEQLGILNAQLAQANETKATLFGIIGHDLRAPAGKIVQLLQLQKDNPEMLSAEARARHEVRLKTASENVLETMEDLLLWSKSQMQHFTPQLTGTAMYPLVQKEIDFMQDAAADKEMIITNEIARDFVQHTDENFVAVIIRNLLQNAVKYGEHGTPIAITAIGDTLSITNTASLADTTQLNDRLARQDINSKNAGLGLQISRDLATAIHAGISFAGENSGSLTASLSWQS